MERIPNGRYMKELREEAVKTGNGGSFFRAGGFPAP
jgi:hypothetical protein